MWVGQIRQVIDGIVEIGVVIVHSAHESANVVHTGKCKASANHVGMFEQTIRGMIRTKRSAHGGNRNPWRLTTVPNKRNHLFAYVSIELRLHVAAMKRMCVLVVKPGPVYGVHAEEFHATRVNQRGQRANHSLPIKFPFVAGAGRKSHQRGSPMPIDHNAHVQAEPMRIPTVIFSFHIAPDGGSAPGAWMATSDARSGSALR